MRIFYAADHEPLPGVNLWHDNLFLPLVDLGHEVVPFDYDLTPHFQHADGKDHRHAAFIAARRAGLERALLDQISRAHRARRIDVFFAYFYSAFCRPDVIREIRSLGICTINWYCNASYQFDLVQAIAPAFDYCLVPEKFRLEDYRRAGARPLYCQEAANPATYQPRAVRQWRSVPSELPQDAIQTRTLGRPAVARGHEADETRNVRARRVASHRRSRRLKLKTVHDSNDPSDVQRGDRRDRRKGSGSAFSASSALNVVVTRNVTRGPRYPGFSWTGPVLPWRRRRRLWRRASDRCISSAPRRRASISGPDCRLHRAG